MKAAIIHAKGQSPVYGEFETPVATDGKVLVHVKASALSNLSRALSGREPLQCRCRLS